MRTFSVLALVLAVSWLLVGAGVRILLQRRLAGGVRVRVGARSAGSVQPWAILLQVIGALGLGFAGPIVDLAGLGVAAPLDQLALHIAGTMLAVAGFAAAFGAQLAMGPSWRVGVDRKERTALVTSGPFGIVRNPIYAGVAAFAVGLVLMVPNVVAAIGLAAAIAGIELEVRFVEKPYLLSAHGVAYARYAARVGRFLPGVGRRSLLEEARR